jgi:hypothetical protein
MSKKMVYALLTIAFLGGWIVADLSKQFANAQDSGKGPKWTHAMDLRVRKAGEKDFTKDTKMWSIEVFRDENNGNLIYISETGSISVVPGK